MGDLFLIQPLDSGYQSGPGPTEVQRSPGQNRTPSGRRIFVFGELLEEGKASSTLETKDFEDRGPDLFGRVAGQACQGFGRRRSLPVAGQAQRGRPDGLVRGSQQSQNACGIALRLNLAGPSRLPERGQGASRGRIIKAARDGLSEQRAQFFGATGLTNELDPRAGAVPRQATLLNDTTQNSARLIRSDGLQGEGQLLFAALGLPGTGFQGGDPGFGEFVDREPEGVVQGGIHGLLEHAQSQLGGSGSWDLGQGTQGLQTDPWMGVLD